MITFNMQAEPNFNIVKYDDVHAKYQERTSPKVTEKHADGTAKTMDYWAIDDAPESHNIIVRRYKEELPNQLIDIALPYRRWFDASGIPVHTERTGGINWGYGGKNPWQRYNEYIEMNEKSEDTIVLQSFVVHSMILDVLDTSIRFVPPDFYLNHGINAQPSEDYYTYPDRRYFYETKVKLGKNKLPQSVTVDQCYANSAPSITVISEAEQHKSSSPVKRTDFKYDSSDRLLYKTTYERPQVLDEIKNWVEVEALPLTEVTFIKEIDGRPMELTYKSCFGSKQLILASANIIGEEKTPEWIIPPGVPFKLTNGASDYWEGDPRLGLLAMATNTVLLRDFSKDTVPELKIPTHLEASDIAAFAQEGTEIPTKMLTDTEELNWQGTIAWQCARVSDIYTKDFEAIFTAAYFEGVIDTLKGAIFEIYDLQKVADKIRYEESKQESVTF